MNNLATITLSILMTCTVCAQSPYPSPPYYYYNHHVLPIQQNAPFVQQNPDQYVLHCDAIVSVLLRELKETNAVVANVTKQMTNEISNLKSELALLKKSAEDKVEKENLKTDSRKNINRTKTQTEILQTEFEPFNIDDMSNKDASSARFCNCLLFQQKINSLGKDLVATGVKFTGITDKLAEDLANTNTADLEETIGDIQKSLATTNSNLKTITDGIQTSLDTTNVNVKKITDGIKTNLDTTNVNLKTVTDGIKTDLVTTNTNLNTLKTQFKASTSLTTIDKEPTSCADLKQLGYQKSGIFSVKANKRVQSVYCDFTKTDATGLQTRIGTVDVKSISVSFYAQLKVAYDTVNTPVPFDLLRTNVGNAMSINTGIFTAPTTATYFFSFSGISFERGGARVELQMKTEKGNWISMGTGYSSDVLNQTFSLQSTLQLNKGDQIRLLLVEGKIHDSLDHFTNFVGFLLEEELV